MTLVLEPTAASHAVGLIFINVLTRELHIPSCLINKIMSEQDFNNLLSSIDLGLPVPTNHMCYMYRIMTAI